MKPIRAHRKTEVRDNKRDESRWSAGVKLRDGYRCRLERWSATRQLWEEHAISGSPDNPLCAAHIYSRNDCGSVKFKEPVGITACLSCHDRYDRRTFKGAPVRVPPDREEAAYRLISLAVTKWHVARRLPPERPVAA